jgi:hypothetical protein
MKKLIVFSVVFALLTGAAFAQVNFGASMGAGAALVHGHTEAENPDFPFAAAGIDDDGFDAVGGSLTFRYTTDGGEAGVSAEISVGEPADFTVGEAFWFVIPEVRLNLGGAGFAREGTPWHYEEGSGNWFGISIFPMEDMLTLNLAFIDEGWLGEVEIGDQYGTVFMAQVVLNVDDIGQFARN